MQHRKREGIVDIVAGIGIEDHGPLSGTHQREAEKDEGQSHR
jgi:hypothetical protein